MHAEAVVGLRAAGLQLAQSGARPPAVGVERMRHVPLHVKAPAVLCDLAARREWDLCRAGDEREGLGVVEDAMTMMVVAPSGPLPGR